ncbi:TetR/AcrR family transcriptional regulator [Sphingobium phenoxybenzoativorans]|uniref:TetR/AcrR family transcriptional regulator n=1 Tax=Sphingobium phenoxybenzoativorans TaxID=1592790 RepID=A0A975Q1C9_9SPHN|nr:TetR/AcrR family transcriptional regulator [Sphingobium phenoxybenzoativorans]QUT05531.1 TetR/AcrR family transcriptional regulator [Sphingobium phenoxybenzoativorans]
MKTKHKIADGVPSSLKRLTSKGERTRTTILDAAERQFAARGYDGVSLRQIMDEAGVQMGQLQYYFPSKEEVFVGVLDRRIEEVMIVYGRSVEELERLEAAGDVTLRVIMRAVMAISRAWLSEDDIGRHRYLRVLGLSTMNFNQPEYVRRHSRVFHPLNNRVAAAIGRLFPDVPEARVLDAYHLIEANLLSLYVNIDSVLARRGELRTGEAVERMYDELETFLVGGVERLLRAPSTLGS